MRKKMTIQTELYATANFRIKISPFSLFSFWLVEKKCVQNSRLLLKLDRR